MKKSDLKKYAKLIARRGVNVKKGQDVIIVASIENHEFAEMVMEECYKAKAKHVKIDWDNNAETLLNLKYQSVEALSEVPNWQIERMKHYVETIPCRIYIMDDDPDALANADQNKIIASSQARSKILKPYRDQLENKYQWTIVGMPGYAWAQKVFPNDSKKVAYDKLWEAIKKTTRLDGDPLKNWEEHSNNIQAKCEALNKLNIKELHYSSKNGTNFTVGLTGKTNFTGGQETSLQGITFEPNMPTEECFTSPDPNTASGVVFATKPLSIYGTLVENFGFRFENGKAVEVIGDEKAKNILGEMIKMDEGACKLGEVALVPFDSPVNQTGVLFYNTLYDENACCHLALGAGFDDTIKDFAKLTKEERKAVGINDSMIHTDFMIGSSDLEIVATTFDGKKVKIFKDGGWAF